MLTCVGWHVVVAQLHGELLWKRGQDRHIAYEYLCLCLCVYAREMGQRPGVMGDAVCTGCLSHLPAVHHGDATTGVM